MKIEIYLGTSGAGKTHLIMQKYMNENFQDVTINNMRCCSDVVNKVLLAGWYKIEARCKGCDTLSMAIINDLIAWLDKRIKENFFKIVVIDGDRVNNSKMLNFLIQHKDIVEVIYVNTSLETIYKRRPECNKTFIETTQTKTHNMVMEYKQRGFKVTEIAEEKQRWF